MEKKPEAPLSIEDAKRTFSYNPETGVIFWKITSRQNFPAGSVAGRINRQGYLRICYKGKSILGHRLALAITNGKWPTEHVDHINGTTSDNRLCNLRLVTRSQNMMNSSIRSNNKSGEKGVTKKGNKWRAQITCNKLQINLGVFDSIKDASFAYQEAARIYHKDYARLATDISRMETKKTPARAATRGAGV